ncbi:uncharacterized protein CcaverHIS019_0411450 [Cutaneotrichosporon cavernicola]|uniref:Carboxylic ester hydrolase n=1 Tax=Cutaneotrichosporon cavernicola TaxID=279322 RepID=A0AA48QWF4_9TREE|nr:uncharacterized protein CcaverHIS019_0411450 [Cutaneotrichosporon cavernicola]BEI92325.1 hypothetical protein CcaverHIS019_0411450 [Cutaneotrichosporon cavernicola]BEJ07866.1 hypothetical protein CcaverHIS641_0411350 [Cutaneotrichosporon cavernicola]
MDDMTGEQLALPSDRVRAYTRHGPIVGGRVRNGVQVFLNVPYALPVSRWTDAAPLPPTYRYPEREYTVDGAYCAQPGRAYTAHIPVRQRLGLGQPTENPFFADIYVPSDAELECPPLESLERTGLRPVRVFVHGGFLQFGSTSGSTYNQQFFAAEHFGEVRVLLGHRVSALGFLASPRLEGNWGFKDVWLGIEWVQSNIAAFGGDPTQIHLSGLSGGAHIVHQLLHRAARGQDAAFVSATLQSNAILTDPLSRHAREDQFAQLASALGLDPNDPLVVERMRDREQIPTGRLIAAIEGMGTESTFRGVADDLHGRDQMAFQASGELARGLAAAGVRVVVLGDVRDEAHFYAQCHPCPSPADLVPNVARYYPLPTTTALLASYPPLTSMSEDACQARMGRVLADGQVHLPVRLLARDLAATGLPVVRYTIEMVVQALGTRGSIPHGSDLPIQHLRLSAMTEDEARLALEWHAAISAATQPALQGDGSAFVQKPEDQVLTLDESGVSWRRDWRWDTLRAAEAAVRPPQPLAHM